MKTKVLIVDDHAIMREGLRTLIAARSDMEVAGEACGGLEAIEKVRTLRPDVVVLDISMPGMNGIETARRLLEASPHLKIVALSVHTDRRFVAEMLRAGACGYLPKDGAFDELAMAVLAAAAGKTYVSPSVAGEIVRDFVGNMPQRAPRPHEALSTREREVLVRMAEGESAKEAAFAMGVESKTVDTFRRRLMAKLDLHCVADLTKYAIREGLIVLDD